MYGVQSMPLCAACMVTKRPVKHHPQERGRIAALPAACMRGMSSAAGRLQAVQAALWGACRGLGSLALDGFGVAAVTGRMWCHCVSPDLR